MLKSKQSRAASWKSMHGLSLVELLVGVALGLFVVAGAATLVATQLGDSRRLVLEAQIQQELRATADIVTREIRRAGYWQPANPPTVVWVPGSSYVVAHYFDEPASSSAPYFDAANNSPAGPDLGLRRSPITNGLAGAKGFQLDNSSPGGVGVLQLVDSGGSAQAMTDPATLNVTNFSVRIKRLTSARMACPVDCSTGGQACWPTVEVREVLLRISGQSTTDSSVKRTVFSNIRLRNDRIVDNLNAPTTGAWPFNISSSSAALCPAP